MNNDKKEVEDGVKPEGGGLKRRWACRTSRGDFNMFQLSVCVCVCVLSFSSSLLAFLLPAGSTHGIRYRHRNSVDVYSTGNGTGTHTHTYTHIHTHKQIERERERVRLEVTVDGNRWRHGSRCNWQCGRDGWSAATDGVESTAPSPHCRTQLPPNRFLSVSILRDRYAPGSLLDRIPISFRLRPHLLISSRGPFWGCLRSENL